MTVSSEVKRFSFAGSGTTGPFTIGFVILAETDLAVTKVVDATGVETTLTLNAGSSGYTVNAALTEITPTEAVAVGETLVGVRDLGLTQGSDYIANDPFPAEVTETALDRLTMIAQQLQERIDRSITLAVTSSLTNVTFPDPTDDAGKYLRVNSTEDGYEHFDIALAGALTVSSFAETLLDDTTQGAMQTTLGLVPGTDVQAYDAGLADIAALAVTDGNIIVGNGTNWVAESGATAKTSLGVLPQARADASSAAYVDFAEDTDNGTDKVRLIAPATLSADATVTLPSATATVATVALAETLTNKTVAVGSGNDVQTQVAYKTGTRDVSTASGTQDVTSFGFTPRYVEVVMSGASAGGRFSDGCSDGTNNSCTFRNSVSGNFTHSTAYVIVAEDSSGVTNYLGTIAMISDGVRITWTKTGSPTGTIGFSIRAWR